MSARAHRMTTSLVRGRGGGGGASHTGKDLSSPNEGTGTSRPQAQRADVPHIPAVTRNRSPHAQSSRYVATRSPSPNKEFTSRPRPSELDLRETSLRGRS